MTDEDYRKNVSDMDDNDLTPHRLEIENQPAETIDLANLLKADLSASGSFDIRGGIWASTFGKLTQALPIPTLLVDQSFNIVVANQACGKIGAQHETITDTHFCNIFPAQSAREEVRSLLEKLFSNRKPLVIEAALRIGNRPVWARLNLRSIRVFKDRFALILVEDLTAEKKQYSLIQKHANELAEARDILEETVQERTKDLKRVNEKLLKEIAERKRHQASLQQSRENFNSIVEKSADGILIVDADGMVIYANAFADALFGRPKGSLSGSTFGVPLASGGITNIDTIRTEGKTGVAQMRVVLTDWDDSSAYLCVLRDITSLFDAHKELEQRVEERTSELKTLNQDLLKEIEQRMEAEKAIEESLREKEVLLQEIHHRVKNNLQIICSLLDLQSDRVEDEKTRLALHDSETRIRSMALIHEQLYCSEDLASVDFQNYLDQLTGSLLRSYDATSRSVTMEQHVDSVLLSIKTALPVGLILNELISNCLKHAFPVGVKGNIRIEFHSNEAEATEYTLVVADNGIGFPHGFDHSKSKSLGMRLIKTLAEDQLEGQMEILQERGTEFRITFPDLEDQREKGEDT